MDLVRCLPLHLRHRRIEIVTRQYHATIVNYQLIKITVRENQRRHDIQCERRRASSTLFPAPLVQYVEPPCLAHDDRSEQCIRIALDRDQTELSSLRVVTELKGRVVDDHRTTTQETSHDVKSALLSLLTFVQHFEM